MVNTRVCETLHYLKHCQELDAQNLRQIMLHEAFQGTETIQENGLEMSAVALALENPSLTPQVLEVLFSQTDFPQLVHEQQTPLAWYINESIGVPEPNFLEIVTTLIQLDPEPNYECGLKAAVQQNPVSINLLDLLLEAGAACTPEILDSFIER